MTRQRVIGIIAGWVCGLTPAGLRAAENAKPALVVVVVVDQMRGDYLEAFGDQFGPNGFKRLMRDGAWFSQAYLDYGVTATGPGHASMFTGTTPSIHGIVANDWVEQTPRPTKVYCCSDESVRGVGYPDGESPDGRSPRNLRAPTLGDAFKAATDGRSKIWCMSLKDRSAVLPGGMQATGALWLERQSGNWVSSSYYAPALPGWAKGLNEERFVDRYFHERWERLLPAALYGPRFLTVVGKDGRDDVREPARFPKTLGEKSKTPDRDYYADLANSPFGNELVLEAARRAVAAEGLGGDDAVDLLVLGFSSNDIIGHYYGPDSDEVMDCTLRTDRQIAELLSWLDQHVGQGKYLFALCADHGMAPIPERAQALGYGGGRIDPGDLRRFVNDALAKRFREAGGDSTLVDDVNLPWLYLDESKVAAARLELDEVARAAARSAAEFKGIERAVAACDFAQASAGDELTRQMRNSHFPGRSGQVYLHWSKYWYKGAKSAGHGAAYTYDQHIPVLLYGPEIRPGKHAQKVRATGMAATICAALGIAPPSPKSETPLAEALAPAQP